MQRGFPYRPWPHPGEISTHRGQFTIALILVGLAGMLGGMVLHALIARPAHAQLAPISMDPPAPGDVLDLQALNGLLKAAFPELALEEPLTGAYGRIVNVLYDTETGRFGAILKRFQKKTILLLTDDPSMVATLGMAFENERLINATVQPVDPPGQAKKLLDAYQVLDVLTE